MKFLRTEVLKRREGAQRRAENAASPPAREAASNFDPEIRDEIVRLLAYQYWTERGCPFGSPEEDWYRAERDLRRRAA